MKTCLSCGCPINYVGRQSRRKFCVKCYVDPYRAVWMFSCNHCNTTQTKISQNRPKFCNPACAALYQHQHQTVEPNWDRRSNRERWTEKYGEIEASRLDDEYRLTLSRSIHQTDMARQKDSARKRFVAMNSSNKGKTLEEMYGTEKGNEIRHQHSVRMTGSRNPAYGKVYFNGGKSVKGKYKEIFFRSLLEYSFLKHLETNGVDVTTEVMTCTPIPYQVDGHDRTYTPDFHVIPMNIVYEIKPAYVLQTQKLLMREEVKWTAALQHLTNMGIQFKVITENDFPKIKFDIARLDVDVVWVESTFKYFNKDNE